MNPLFLPPPIRAAKSCSLNTTRSRNTIPTRTKSPTKKSCSHPMRRQSLQTAIPYGTPPKRRKNNGTPSLPGGSCLPSQGKSRRNSTPTLSVTTAGSFFVSKGMIADFAIHDKGDGNPHAHILLTMRAMDEKGKWLPKCRKVYDLDKNGERIRLPSGRWKSHKENTVDWNDQKYAEIWRQGWADTANRYLEANNRPERLDLRSYARQEIDKIPTVHMGAAVCQMEKKGIQTSIGNLNRDIKAANSLMQSIRQMVRHLKGWIADLKEKKAALMEALEQTKEPTIPELLSQYLELRSGQRADWTSRGKLKGTVADFNKVQAAMDFLRKKGISTVESLDTRLDEISQTAVSVMESVKKSEKRIKAIDMMSRSWGRRKILLKNRKQVKRPPMY